MKPAAPPQQDFAQTKEVFDVKMTSGRGVDKLEYEGPVAMMAKERRIGEGLVLTDQEILARQAKVPAGGRLTVIIHGTGIYSTMTRNYTVIVFDERDEEILRRTGDDSIPTPTHNGWLSAMIVDLSKPIQKLVKVFVVNNQSGYREEFEVRRR